VTSLVFPIAFSVSFVISGMFSSYYRKAIVGIHGSIKGEDCKLIVLQHYTDARSLYIYRKAIGTKDGRLRQTGTRVLSHVWTSPPVLHVWTPPPVQHLQTPPPVRHLQTPIILTLSHIRNMQRNTGENEKIESLNASLKLITM